MALAIISGRQAYRRFKGFTFIELMMVLVVIAMLVSIALPRYFEGLKRSKEAVLKEDLKVMRTAIDHFFADKGVYPATLDDLVEQRYIHAIPEDPITESAATWQVDSPPGNTRRVYDIHSGAQTVASDGSVYSTW